MKTNIINLGKKLVKEFKLDPGVDTLSKWMAHYIAQQMTIAKIAKGKKKIAADKQCFETILKLWKHRSYYPEGHRPFENFDAILRALEKLDTDNKDTYYYSSRNNDTKIPDSVKDWLDIALEIDQSARIWLEYVFGQAIMNATDKKVIEWLRAAVGFYKEKDISIIVRFMDDDLTHRKYHDRKQEKAKVIKSKIQKLRAFGKFNRNLLKIFENELQTLS